MYRFLLRLLSDLRTKDVKNGQYQTNCYPRVYTTKLVSGAIPNYFLRNKKLGQDGKPLTPLRKEPFRKIPGAG